MAGQAGDDEIAKLLRGLLALAAHEREERQASAPGGRKTELILDAAGLDSSEIAALIGKQPGSVRMALSRARKAGEGARGASDA